MNSKIISRKEAADMLGVCTQSVSNYIKRGLLRQAGCARKGVCFVYLKEVEALAGKAKDLEKTEASIAAYEKVRKNKIKVTDDVAAYVMDGAKISFVENLRPNPKITVPEDIAYVEFLLNKIS